MQAITSFCQRMFSGHNQAVSPFSELPAELILHIFSHLNAYDLRKIAPTCKAFNLLTKDRVLDISKLEAFKKKRSERITYSSSYVSFFLHKNQLIITDRKNDIKTFEIINVLNNHQDIIVPRHAIRKGELDDLYYVIYFDDGLMIKFLYKNDDFRTYSELKLSNEKLKVREIQTCGNTMVIEYGDHHLCIKNGYRYFTINPIEFEDDSYAELQHFNLSEQHIIVFYDVDTRDTFYTLFQCIDISTEKVINQKIVKNCFSELRVTDRYVVFMRFLSENITHAAVNVYDLQFNFIQQFDVCVRPDLFNKKERFESDEFYYAYEDRLAVLVNTHNLLFYDLNTGVMLQSYDIKRSIKFGSLSYFDIVRVSAHKDKVIASNGNSIELYDLHTGKKMHRFFTSARPVWLKLGNGYDVRYTLYDKQKRDYYYTHLVEDEKRIYPSKRQRKKERQAVLQAVHD